MNSMAVLSQKGDGMVKVSHSTSYTLFLLYSLPVVKVCAYIVSVLTTSVLINVLLDRIS